MLPPRDKTSDKTSIWPLWGPHASESIDKEITMQIEVIEPTKEKLNFYFTMKVRKSVWNIEDPLKCLRVYLNITISCD